MKTFKTKAVEHVQVIKGIVFPAHITFRQLLIMGPPGAGKTTLVSKLGGWPEEGYVDLSLNRWWTAQSLSLRPRELHLGIPFKGVDQALAVFDSEWLNADPPLEIDYERIQLPPEKRYFFSVDWYRRYVFEFLLPPPNVLLMRRLERSRRYTHKVDEENLDLDTVTRQLKVYEHIAHYFHQQGLSVYIREDTDGIPMKIIDLGIS